MACQSTSSASLSPFLLHRGDGPGQVDLSCRHCRDSQLPPAGRLAYPGTDYGAFLDLFFFFIVSISVLAVCMDCWKVRWIRCRLVCSDDP